MTEPSTSCPDDLVDLAARLADASRPVLRRWFRSDVAVDLKGDASPVTRADREAEAAMRAIIERERPADGIIGEEHGAVREDAEHVWVLDPLDGTRGFVIGKPLFGTLIALVRGGRPILGVIDMPMLGERWIGAAGRPTLFNGEPARVRACPSLAEARINTTSPAMFKGALKAAFERVRDAAADCHYGGDCYGYGLVASGFLDLTIEASMQTYDYLPLIAVVEGAGGVITDWSGRPLGLGSDGTVLAAGDPRVHAEAIGLLSGAK
jgi:inositol-phosphate phosphatase / L-galactose 1-phosphate phosphatase / histidinol-phosphatase